MTPFEEDVLEYQRELPRLIREHGEGRFVLLRDGGVQGVYCSHEEAMEAGYQRFGLDGFLTKEILAGDVGKERFLLETCRT